jgi:hypothetical protein
MEATPSHPAVPAAVRALALGAALIAACAALPASAADERIALDLRLARQAERFQSREADSLGLSVSTANVAGMVMDMRLFALPMKQPARPSVHVRGRALMTEQVYVAAAGGVGSPERTMESPLLGVSAGIGLVLPLALIDGDKGVNATIWYDGGVVIAADTGENFMQTSTVTFGFEREGGWLDGSLLEASYGHSDLFGPTYAAGRWGARMLVFMGLGRIGRAKPPEPGTDAAPAASPPVATAAPDGAPLRAFVELEVNSDGQPGADTLAGRAGLALDVGALLGGLFGR